MENYKLSQTGTGLHIEGFPDATRLVAIEGPKARQLAHLALHRHDLEQTLHCLDEINRLESPRTRIALWDHAIVTFNKCFAGGSARVRLDENVVYSGEPLGKEVFAHFKALRDKHVVHDENAYTQCQPCAAINDGKKAYKVEKVLALQVTAVTLDQGHYSNLRKLATHALAWITAKFDELCDQLARELEAEPYQNLTSRREVTVTVPTVEQLKVRRTTY